MKDKPLIIALILLVVVILWLFLFSPMLNKFNLEDECLEMIGDAHLYCKNLQQGCHIALAEFNITHDVYTYSDEGWGFCEVLNDNCWDERITNNGYFDYIGCNEVTK